MPCAFRKCGEHPWRQSLGWEDVEAGISQRLTVMEDDNCSQEARLLTAKLGDDSDPSLPSLPQLLTQLKCSDQVT